MDILANIEALIEHAIEKKLIETRDKIYIRNRVLHLLQLHPQDCRRNEAKEKQLPAILERITTFAVESAVIPDNVKDREIFSARLMDCFIARPSVINAIFNKKLVTSPKAATDYFYELSKHSNYIPTEQIRHNISFQTQTSYGNMDITINISKPEKNPEITNPSADMNKPAYPKCLLCIENEGYAGQAEHPARANHRTIKMRINHETWFFQYSPYQYYPEHSILFSEKHRPMNINEQTFANLLEFTERFPHYFIGSNADLPIVGGSIPSHDHYQAGKYAFPMERANICRSFTFSGLPNVSACILHWPMAVIRLASQNKNDIIHAANHILLHWREYEDTYADIIPFTDKTAHNTITPIARKRHTGFELDLVLRNNRTSTEHPDGIFHPHQDVQHIKKENIGLIETMGLAVLPGRLKTELAAIKHFLHDQTDAVADYHKKWAMELKMKYQHTNFKHTEALLQYELGIKFLQILHDASVFKQTPEGKAAFHRFIDSLSYSYKGATL